LNESQCVKEIKKHEYRVGLTPDCVSAYGNNGHEVYIESSAGIGSGFSDDEYVQAGATIVTDTKKIWELAEMIVKVKEPLSSEYPLIKENQILYTYLHLAANQPLTEALIKSKAKGVAYETLRARNGSLPLLMPMSEIAGRFSVQEGARCLEKPFGGIGILLAGVPGVKKAKVVIVGGGIVGSNACKVAVGMGADVSIIDLNLNRLAQLDELYGSQIQTIYSTSAALEKKLSEADLVIGAVLIPGAATPRLIKRKHLKLMKKGSVIVDVAVDQGGCYETTVATYHDNPTFEVRIPEDLGRQSGRIWTG
jgi:alanine dehydrogenase